MFEEEISRWQMLQDSTRLVLWRVFDVVATHQILQFIKPGSLEKSTQTLDLNEDGTVNYTEVGNTSMESWTSVGHGEDSFVFPLQNYA